MKNVSSLELPNLEESTAKCREFLHLAQKYIDEETRKGLREIEKEASEAESPADFIHKLRLALKELKESRVWLLFGERIDPSRSVVALRQESHELMLMMSSSIATVQRRAQQG